MIFFLLFRWRSLVAVLVDVCMRKNVLKKYGVVTNRFHNITHFSFDFFCAEFSNVFFLCSAIVLLAYYLLLILLLFAREKMSISNVAFRFISLWCVSCVCRWCVVVAVVVVTVSSGHGLDTLTLLLETTKRHTHHQSVLLYIVHMYSIGYILHIIQYTCTYF